MRQLAALCCTLISSVSIAGELSVRTTDLWTIEFETDFAHTAPLTVRTTITQPQGFTQIFESQVERDKEKVRWRVIYPLIDEGRFDVEPGNWNGYWVMGNYRFKAELLDGTKVINTTEATFDPMSLCQRDNYGPIFSKYPQQFIECARRGLYIDADRMSFTIRTLPQRVAKCSCDC